MTMILDGTLGATLPVPLPVAQGGTGLNAAGFLAGINYSMIRVGVSAANCTTTDTAIRNYTTLLSSQGADITRTAGTPGTTNIGEFFTINTSGIYAITVTDNLAGATLSLGASLNSSQRTTALNSIANADRLCCMDTAAGTFAGTASWVGYLVAGSVIRSHTASGLAGGPTAQFTITRTS